MPVRDQAWVTYVKDDPACIKALVLAKSLRRTMTKRRLVVLASPSVTKSMRILLVREFDEYIKLDGGHEHLKCVSIDLYAKIFCWSLPFMEKCIFIDPECLVMHPSDNLFDYNGASAVLTTSGKLDLSLFVFSPQLEKYEELMETIRKASQGNGRGFKENGKMSEYFGKWMISLNDFHPMDKKYLKLVDLQSATLSCEFLDLMIVRFSEGLHPLNQNKNSLSTGVLENCVLDYWENLYNGEIQLFAQNSETFHKEVNTAPENVNYLKWNSSLVNEPIAIVGMSCRLPGANNVDEFWQLLSQGVDAIQTVPSSRWTHEHCTIVDPECRNIQAGFLNCPIDQFDGKFFGVSPMELAYMDPQQRFLMEILWEALEDAGIDPLSLRDTRTGIFTGTWRDDYRELITESGFRGNEFYRSYMGNSLGAGAGRLAFVLGACGSNIATESGCSSSIVAVGLACKSLRNGDSNVALACGVNLLLHPFLPKEMHSIVAPDGRCKAFDARADGFGRAEGCGVLVLKRYSDAVNDGDNILALIRGYGDAQEGPSRSMGTPTVKCESLSMKIALEDAGVKPHEVSYVEAHGTGTPVGDPMEIEAIAQVYSKGRTEPLFVGSVKTNVGHTESCSGITGIIKVVLSLKNEIIPPHLHLENLNPYVNLDKVPAKVPLTCEPWPKTNGKLRYAGVSSFGITGTDAHVIIQEPPTPTVINRKPKIESNRPLQILTLSAKSENALEESIVNYKKYLEQSDESIEDITYTANTGRSHFAHRIAAIGSNTSEILQKLSSASLIRKQIPEVKQKVCFLFTGQGSQYQGMSKTLYETCPIFRMSFDLCNKILIKSYGISIREVIWGDIEDDNLKRTIFSQTSIFCIEYCLLKMWESWGVKPDCVLGHSLGEFAAAVAAGILNLENALKLVAERSRLIENLPRGKMLVIKANHDQVKPILEKTLENNIMWLDYAAINSNEQTVLAGPAEAIEQFSIICKRNDLKTHMLEATHAFHSRQMDQMLDEYRNITSTVKYGEAQCQYISGMEGQLLQSEDIHAEYWVRHTRESVKFLDASIAAYNEGCRLFLEVGPQPVLSSLMMINIVNSASEPLTFLPSIRRKEDNWITVANTLSQLYVNGITPDWKSFDVFYQRKKIQLPFYPFQRKKHWFEIKAGSIQKQVHPMLGCSLPNVTGTKLYQGNIDLDKKPFLRDHAIGKHIIFPGAGYLEMILGAGHASTLGSFEDFYAPLTPIMVENLAIESPLEIIEGNESQIQTAVKICEEDSKEDTVCGTNVSVYSLLSVDASTTKWIRHAMGTFNPAVSHNIQSDSLKILEERIIHEHQTDDVYEKWSKVGLEFGPAFKSVHKFLEGEDEVLAHIHLEDNSEDFLCHPVLIDAMIQTTMMTEKLAEDKLRVPVTIGKFVWLAKSLGNSFYIHGHIREGGEKVTNLFDESGKILAIMSGVETIETSVPALLRVLETQRLCLPKLYEDIWRQQIGPLKSRVEFDHFVREKEFQDQFVETLNHDEITPTENQRIEKCDRLTSLLIIDILRQLNLDPEVGEILNLEQVLQSRKIKSLYTHLIRRYFEMLSEQGFLYSYSTEQLPTTWTVIKRFTSKSQIVEEKKSLMPEIGNDIEVKLQIAVAEKVAETLLGHRNVLDVLFPQEGKEDVSAEALYTTSQWISRTNQLLSDSMKYVLENKASKSPNAVLRILEIGSGTGSATSKILNVLEEHNAKYEYTFTDISQGFFVRAERKFESFAKKMYYKLLNIEEDPMSQGFNPYHYDIIIASNVIHATKDLRHTLRQIKSLLTNSGIFFLLEILKPAPWIDMIFGPLDGFWKFTDFDVRPAHPYVSSSTWTRVMKESGFDSAVAVHTFDKGMGVILAQNSGNISISSNEANLGNVSKIWLVFEADSKRFSHLQNQFLNINRIAIQIAPNDKDNNCGNSCKYSARPNDKVEMEELIRKFGENIEGIVYLWGYENEKEQSVTAQGFLHLSQALLSGVIRTLPKLCIVTQGAIYIGDQGSLPPSPGTLWGMSRTLRSEQSNLKCRNIDMDPDESNVMVKLKMEELFQEIWTNDLECQVAFRQRNRYCARLNSLKVKRNCLTLPNSNRLSLILPETNAISDLKFGPMGKVSVKGRELEILVKASALNFKDILNVIKPDAQFENSNAVGADFAGVITAVGPNVKNWKVGDAILGCNFENGALPSHIKSVEDVVVPLPDEMTFEEGCTLPAVFATAYYCIVSIADMKPGETLLVHAASGGVGLCAIQIAQYMGLRFIATAGSKRKRAFLRSIGIEHVFHSRNTDYEKQILEVTNDRGIDCVLNSLTGPGFKEATLNVCTKEARFIEMSKLNVWKPEEVTALRPDVNYTIVDLTSVSTETWTMLLNKLDEFLKQKIIKPIPYTRFEAVDIREALTHLQKAKHIGKVVISLPEMVSNNGQIEAKNLLFSDRSTYLITGGLGGIGLEVAKWMVELGASHIVLCGRHEPNQKAIETIEALRTRGKNIKVMQADVGDRDLCKNLIDSVKNDPSLPPLRGIMHAAGCLSDGTIPNQSWEKFQATFNAKVNGTLNLHEETLKLEYPLEHFVMYSSLVATFGGLGQSNHAGANAFMDTFAHYRNSLGLPALTINWGQWGQVGVAAQLEVPGITPFTPLQALNVLELMLKTHRIQCGVIEGDQSLWRTTFPWIKSYASELKESKGDKQGIALQLIKSEEFWQAYDAAFSPEDKIEVIKSNIVKILRIILKLESDEKIDEGQHFQEMGLDSLMMVELKNLLQTVLGNRVTLTVSALSECHTIILLSNRLFDLINGNYQKKVMTKEEKIQLIREDCELPSEICSVTDKPSEIKSILFTGATGQLGPHILQEISNRPEIKRIVCLVRPRNQISAAERLEKHLEKLGLLDSTTMEKVDIIQGSVADKNLGISKGIYDKLAEDVDAVIHCAVKNNHIEPYLKSEHNITTDIRSVNVSGTKNILAFASTTKTKWVYHASAFVAVTKISLKEKDKVFPETWPEPDEFDELPNTFGYALSKFICDRLLAQAVDRGIPCKVFRFPFIAGDTKFGRFSLDQNHGALRLLNYIKLGMMPSVPLPMQVLPVDTCSKVSLQIFFNKEAPVGIYNVSNPHPRDEQEMVGIAEEFGYSVKIVTHTEFIEKIKEEGEDSVLYSLKELYLSKDFANAVNSGSSMVVAGWLDNREGFYRSKKLCRFIPNIKDVIEDPLVTIKRDAHYAKRSGLFTKFNLN